ncbi:hypothetical protein MKX01_017629, partial [Papaver californicum]
MTVEELLIRGSSGSEDEQKNDLFPIGMRVLASLLSRCQYHGTSSSFTLFDFNGMELIEKKFLLDLASVNSDHKYRLYLKRISCVASQQANMVAALGGKDDSYLRMSALDGLGDFHGFRGPGQLPNGSLASYSPAGMLGRLNTPVGMGLCGPSSGMMQLGKLHQIVIPRNQNGNFLQGCRRECSSSIDPTAFPGPNNFPDTGVTVANSNHSFQNVHSNSLLLLGVPPQTQNRVGFGNQSSVRMTSVNSESFEFGFGASSHLPDLGRCNESWPSSAPLSGFPSNPLPLDDNPFNHADLSSNILRDNISSINATIGSNSLDVPSNSVTNLLDSRRDLQSAPIGVNAQHDKFSSFANLGDNVGRSMNLVPKQKWISHKQDYNQTPNLLFSSSNPLVPVHGVAGPLGQNNSTMSNRKIDLTSTLQPTAEIVYCHDRRFSLGSEIQNKSQGGGVMSNSCGSLEDLMSAMIKREREELTLRDGDIFPLKT